MILHVRKGIRFRTDPKLNRILRFSPKPFGAVSQPVIFLQRRRQLLSIIITMYTGFGEFRRNQFGENGRCLPLSRELPLSNCVTARHGVRKSVGAIRRLPLRSGSTRECGKQRRFCYIATWPPVSPCQDSNPVVCHFYPSPLRIRQYHQKTRLKLHILTKDSETEKKGIDKSAMTVDNSIKDDNDNVLANKRLRTR